MDTNGHIYLIHEISPSRDSITHALRMSQYEVHLFSTPAEFFKLTNLLTPAAVLIKERLHKICAVQLALVFKSQGRSISTIVLNSDSSPQEIVDSFLRGASDFIIGPFIDEKLIPSVKQAIESDIKQTQLKLRLNSAYERYERLTSREKDVCKLIAQGMKTALIAKVLDISPATLKIHKARVYKKLEVTSIVEIVRLTDMVAKECEPYSHIVKISN